MKPKYGQIAESKNINQAIYDCFDLLDEKEQKKFVNKFKEQPHSDIQVMHTFRELILGAYLSDNHFRTENDRVVNGKTPDWSLLDVTSKVIAIVELVNHHIDNKTNENILAQRKAGKIVISYWANSNDPSFERLYFQIQEKASKYKNLAADLGIPFVVAVFIDFLAEVDVHELRDCVTEGETSLFESLPDLSGVLHFEENNGSYYFTYIENPFALRRINIPTGCLKKS